MVETNQRKKILSAIEESRGLGGSEVELDLDEISLDFLPAFVTADQFFKEKDASKTHLFGAGFSVIVYVRC